MAGDRPSRSPSSDSKTDEKLHDPEILTSLGKGTDRLADDAAGIGADGELEIKRELKARQISVSNRMPLSEVLISD